MQLTHDTCGHQLDPTRCPTCNQHTATADQLTMGQLPTKAVAGFHNYLQRRVAASWA